MLPLDCIIALDTPTGMIPDPVLVPEPARAIY